MIDINNKNFNFYTAIDELTDSEFKTNERFLNKINFDQTIFVISEKYIPENQKFSIQTQLFGS